MSIRDYLNRPLCYRRDGTPYPGGSEGCLQWAAEYEKVQNRRVALDKLPNGVEVSTVWLGIDHNHGLTGRPLIFETMLFVKQYKRVELFGRVLEQDRESIGEQWRYSTEEEALRGHKMLVKKWSKFKTADQVLNNPK